MRRFIVESYQRRPTKPVRTLVGPPTPPGPSRCLTGKPEQLSSLIQRGRRHKLAAACRAGITSREATHWHNFLTSLTTQPPGPLILWRITRLPTLLPIPPAKSRRIRPGLAVPDKSAEKPAKEADMNEHSDVKTVDQQVTDHWNAFKTKPDATMRTRVLPLARINDSSALLVREPRDSRAHHSDTKPGRAAHKKTCVNEYTLSTLDFKFLLAAKMCRHIHSTATGKDKKISDCNDKECPESLFHPLSLFRNGCADLSAVGAF
ncbi:hypothetical protein C8F01DRAFT_1084953 [Mycena amicta]|nr:hypothetical protein C8F01DRAFT_1084953 [Mycena amicta]